MKKKFLLIANKSLDSHESKERETCPFYGLLSTAETLLTCVFSHQETGVELVWATFFKYRLS